MKTLQEKIDEMFVYEGQVLDSYDGGWAYPEINQAIQELREEIQKLDYSDDVIYDVLALIGKKK